MGFQWTGVGVVAGSAAVVQASCAITVPDGVYWEIENVHLSYISTATAGNRAIGIQFRDSGPYVFKEIYWTTVQPASKQWRYDTNQVAASTFVATAAIDFQTVPFTPVFLPPGYSLVFADLAAIDAAADTGVLSCQYKEYRYVPDVQTVAIQGPVQMTGNIGLVQG